MTDIARLAVEIGSLFIVAAGILWRLSSMATRFELIGTQQASEIKELKEAVRGLIEQNSRIDRLDERQLAEGKRLDDLTSRLNRFVNGRS